MKNNFYERISAKSSLLQKLNDHSSQVVAICVAILVACSFCIQYFVSVIQSYVLLGMITACATAVLFFFGRRTFRINALAGIWTLAVAAILVSTFRTPLDINLYIEAYIFCVCFVLLLYCGNTLSVFEISFKIILGFSIYYAISVWLQILMPHLFDFFVDLLPLRAQKQFAKWDRGNVGFAGLSTNPGYTAGHLVAGLLLLLSNSFGATKKKILQNGLWILLLFSALLMTGKRAHLLFFMVAAFAIFPITGHGKKRWVRLLLIVGLGVAALAFLLLFGDKLTFIPGLGRITETIKGLFSGADVTNNRLPLYALALRLFSANPVFGVGWGQFRVMSVGAVTEATELDAHNIYLQLLAETGIIGVVCILIPILFFFGICVRTLIDCLDKHPENNLWRSPLLFAFCYQVFFLAYGMTGNPLYDLNYIILYFFTVAITCAYYHFQKPFKRRKETL